MRGRQSAASNAKNLNEVVQYWDAGKSMTIFRPCFPAAADGDDDIFGLTGEEPPRDAHF